MRTLGIAVAACWLSWAPAVAAGYPDKPIRLVTGSAPAGGSDFVARVLSERLNERFGQPVIVDNRPGAGGTIGAHVVVKSSADGYTMLVSTGSAIAVSPALHPLPYDVQRDLAPITLISRAPFALVVNPAVPAQSAGELIQLAKSRPGQITYASSGIGSMAHLSMELFRSMTGVNLVHVPYKGSSPAAIDLISGQVQVAFNSMIPTLPHVKSGKLRALAVSGPVRSAVLPDVPTVAERSVPGYESVQWYGLMAPAGTPGSILDLLHREMIRILQEPQVRTRLMNEGGDVVANSPGQFAAYIKVETAKWSKVVAAGNIKAE